MSKLLSLFIITSLFINCSSFNYVDAPYLTNTKYKNKYHTFLEETSVLKHYGYHYTLEKIPSNNLEILKYYHPDKMVMTHFITQNTITKTLEGKYVEWYDDGTVWISGSYKNNQKEGKWIEDFSEGYYEKNLKVGNWTTFDKEGRISSKVDFINGEKVEGSLSQFDTLGQIIIPEIENSKEDEILEERMPRFAGCENIEGDHKAKKNCADQKMLQYIYKRLKYPSIARMNSLQGSALIKFVVEKDGSVSNITVYRGLCKEIEAECLRIFENMPTWEPGYQRGKPVRVQFTIPIKFKLE